MRWVPLPVPDLSNSAKWKMVVRLNALGSLFFFEKFVLQRSKLSENLHKPVLESLETDRPRFLLEMPRDHYKTVMVTEGRSMWRSLPFNEIDEMAMRELGYDDAWIAWMKRCHNPARRALTVSEIIGNAVKIGKRIDWHYQSNDRFRFVFEDIIPTNADEWNSESKTHRCSSRGPQGEGTYDYLGVGGALQSRHYDDVTEDDVIGKEALESELVMNKTIDYHRLLIGAFQSYENAAWTVVNNRWAPNDLSGWIRENQPEFAIESHGALGGCCDRHPPGQPIFPEEFTVAILEEIRRVQGPYFFSHQYLNLAVNPEECVFAKDWLRYYEPVASPLIHQQGRHWLRHEVRDGKTIRDIDPNVLIRSMIVDPNHAGEEGRCNHSVVVTGLDPETDMVYLLDVWAEKKSTDDLMKTIYDMAEKWNLREFWLETIAAQKYLKGHIEYRNKVEKRSLTVRELRTGHGRNEKRMRIESLEPLFREGRVWVRKDQSQFLNEYFNYPGSRTVDVLDCLGYATQTWNAIHARNIMDKVREHRDRSQRGRSKVTGY